jgi:3D (Asp-Asp-Asp) domain-containing protein
MTDANFAKEIGNGRIEVNPISRGQNNITTRMATLYRCNRQDCMFETGIQTTSGITHKNAERTGRNGITRTNDSGNSGDSSRNYTNAIAVKITEVARYERSTERIDENSCDIASHMATSRGNKSRIFKITAYTAGPESTGKRPDDVGYGITATGTTVKEHHTIAADWRVLPPGTRVMIEGLDDVYTVEDCGGAVKGNQIDIYIPALKDALDWGVQYRKVIVLPNDSQ